VYSKLPKSIFKINTNERISILILFFKIKREKNCMTINKKIIYIAGYGRSGSTLLERILNCNKRVFALGEVSNLLCLINDKDSLCSCGRYIYQCEFWSNVIRDIKNYDITKLERLQSNFQSVNGYIKYKFIKSYNKDNLYKKFLVQLFNIIMENVPEEVEYIVDSSKTARTSFFRPIALSKIASLNVKMIHLVRDGRGCMWSNIKGSNRRMEKGLEPHIPFAAFRTVISWLFANIAAHIFQITHPAEDYCRIKYEDFVEYPAGTLSKLGKFLSINFDQQIELLNKGGSISIGHQLSGNRLRSQKRITLQIDVEWKKRLKLYHKLLFWILDWPLALWYGYR